jgi:hypothetical protein
VAEELAAVGAVAHVGEPADTASLRGSRRHAKTDRTDSRHLRQILTDGRLPECWIPPAHILEDRALLELYRDLRVEHTRQEAQPGAPPQPNPEPHPSPNTYLRVGTDAGKPVDLLRAAKPLTRITRRDRGSRELLAPRVWRARQTVGG